jgi:hypothetical protein
LICKRQISNGTDNMQLSISLSFSLSLSHHENLIDELTVRRHPVAVVRITPNLLYK